MAPKKSKPPGVDSMLMDLAAPLALRKQLLAQVCMTGDKESDEIVASVLARAAAGNSKNRHQELVNELSELMKAMKEGPIRSGTFQGQILADGSVKRARVLLPDGSDLYPVIPDAEMARKLRRGDRVWVEAQGRAILYHDEVSEATGEVAELVRILGKDTVQVRLGDRGNHSFWISDLLAEQLESGEARPGGSILVCPHRMMAFSHVAEADGFAHYEYLLREPVPDVVVERDIGSPPRFIADLSDHLYTEMTDPDLARKYRMRPSRTHLLTGVSGAGKTLSMQGMWRRVYEIMSEITGVPIEKLPPRVMRLRISEVLSKWLGESDRQIDRFFDEVEQLADHEFKTDDGRSFTLPVVVLCEEIDGLARERGQDSIHDRIQVTLLERLDATSRKLRDKLVLFLFSTNVPHLVDPAFLRRAGGTVERFGRLKRGGFVSVLGKHLRDLPLQANGRRTDPETLHRRVVSEVTGWLFSENGDDEGQLEITFVGASQPSTRYRRDMLTGGLVDRAVQQAAAVACRLERNGCSRPGLTSGLLMRAIDDQVRNIVEQMTPNNVRNYLTLPDGMRVSDVRKLDQPAMLPAEFEQSMSS